MEYHCRVVHDGSHWVGTPPTGIVRTRRKLPRSVSDEANFHIDQAYIAALQAGIKEKDLQGWIAEYVFEKYGEFWGYDSNYVAERIRRQRHNLYLRQRRFRQKAYLNPWNYFFTVSYSDKQMDETTFRERLRKCMSNLHTRRGWKYMGVFEYGEDNGRLHFHALLYVPEGEMLGDLKTVKRYSTKRRRWEESLENSFFKETFGVNQFDVIKRADIKCGRVVNYVIKYLLKSDERIIYSRGIPTEIYAMVDDQDVVTELFDFVRKFVLFDETFTLFSEPDEIFKDEPEVNLIE